MPTALLWCLHNAATEAAGCARGTVYEVIRDLEQVGVLILGEPDQARARVRPPACSATRCNDVARSRVAGSVSIRLDPGAVRGLSGE